MSLRENDNSSAALPRIQQPGLSSPGLSLAAEIKPQVTLAKNAKRSVLAAFRAMGGFSLVKASRWRASRLLVLGYHGISFHDEHLWNPELFIHPDKFARRMEILRRKGYRVVALDEGLSRLAAGDLPAASVAITFDDGLYCFYKTALPVLESLNFPATLYLTTFYSGFQEPVFDVLCSYMLWKSRSRKLDLGAITGEERIFHLEDDEPRQAACAAILAYANRERLTALEKVRFGEQLASELSFDLDFVKKSRLLNLMTADEVADASSRGVSVELHTHRHRTPMDRSGFLREIDDNRMQIEKMTSRSPVHFCYPSGYHDAIFGPWLRARNIRSATTCDPGLVSAGTPPMLVPRLMDVSSLDEIEFEGWLCGAAAALPRRPRKLPTDSRQPASFIDRARSTCQAALLSPSLIAVASRLSEVDPSGEICETWLRGLWTQGAFPVAAQVAIAECSHLSPELPFGAERVILLRAALRSLDRLTGARLDPSTQALLSSQYEFFANPGQDWMYRFDPAAYSYRAYAGMSLLERFPAGRLDWEVSGIRRSWLLKIPRRDVPQVLASIALELRGFRPVIWSHLAFLQTSVETFQEQDVQTSYLRIARCLALRPEIRAIATASWLYSAETHRVSPHLRWTTRLFEENGAIISDLGKAPEDAGFLVGSRQRRMLYESGAYHPTEGLIIWPRRAVLEWLSKQSPEADLRPGLLSDPPPSGRVAGHRGNMNALDQRIQRIFREVFENDSLQVHDDLSAQTLPDWDSLAQVKLILGLEEEFGVKFTTAEVAELNSVQSLKRALAGKGAA